MKKHLLGRAMSFALAAGGVLSGCTGGDARDEAAGPPPVRPPVVGNGRDSGDGDSKPSPRPTPPRRNVGPGVDGPPPATRVDLLAERAKVCPPTRSSAVLPPLIEEENPAPAPAVTMSFAELREAVTQACAGCHQAPSAPSSEKFAFVPEHAGKSFLVRGDQKDFGGIADNAEAIRDVLLVQNGKPAMPLGPARTGDEEGWIRLGRKFDAWIAAGKPDGDYALPADLASTSGTPAAPGVSSASGAPTATSPARVVFDETDIGDCVPEPKEVGLDPELDAWFDAVGGFEGLPKKLSQTDLFSIDSLELGRRGTFSYNVEYPLWADNAEKGRYVHLPARKTAEGMWERAAAVYDPAKKAFDLPDNTRFYKTFYKAVKRADGREVFRKIETRLIVVRKAPREPIVATYQWEPDGSEALLVDTPYRNGKGFKDKLFLYERDEAADATRKYAIPGEQRCVDCHKGGASFVLGFTPLQLNRRKLGEAGRDRAPGEDELGQIDRLVKYGALSGVDPAAADLPKLESARGLAPRGEAELKLQGYAVGNCAHCHNPEGFAMKDNKVKLELTEGSLYDFQPRAMRSMHFDFASNKVFVNTKSFAGGTANEEALRQSYLYLRVSASPKDRELLPFNAMPMHTPGGSNCHLVNLTARWILELSGLDPNTYVSDCKALQDFSWIELDSTEPASWEPRRADWNTAEGMPAEFRELKLDEGMKAIAATRFPLGYYDRKPTCSFPEVAPPAEEDPFWQAWMYRPGDTTAGEPARVLKKPLGELYLAKPGAYMYSSMCAKCHGTRGDGQGPFATSLTVMSDGNIRVANFVSGLFKSDGSNVAKFDLDDGGATRNLAGNYLLWMAMGGTKVNFPPEVAHLTGKHKALMLNLVRDRCAGFLPGSGMPIGKQFYDYGLYRSICFHGNGDPDKIPKKLGYKPETRPPEPINQAAQDAWLDKAAHNAGWAIYEYLKDDASQGRWQPAVNECEKEHPAPGGQPAPVPTPTSTPAPAYAR